MCACLFRGYSTQNRSFCDAGQVLQSALSDTIATNHTWLLSISNVANVTKEANFLFYLLSIILNLNSHMWLVATLWGSIATGDSSTQAPCLDSCLLSCCWSAPLLQLRNHTHKANQLLFHTPMPGHTLASLPEMPFLSSHLQTPWKSWSDFIFLRNFASPTSCLTSSHCGHNLSRPPLYFSECFCCSHHPIAVIYSPWC